MAKTDKGKPPGYNCSFGYKYFRVKTYMLAILSVFAPSSKASRSPDNLFDSIILLPKKTANCDESEGYSNIPQGRCFKAGRALGGKKKKIKVFSDKNYPFGCQITDRHIIRYNMNQKGINNGKAEENLICEKNNKCSSTLTNYESDPKLVGQWETVLPKENGAAINFELGLQTVHTLLLPSGKILIAPGGAWRNRADRTQYYPDYLRPEASTGLFERQDDPFLNTKIKSYHSAVNNVATYDPHTNEFFRIPSPRPVPDPVRKDSFLPNDFFCSGQIQLPDGNALFFGGTQYYFPFRTGNRGSYIYNWIEDAETDWTNVDWTKIPAATNEAPWKFGGYMKEGRWYANAVPLMDGRLVIASGFVGFKNTEPVEPNDMYEYQINSGIDIFDYRVWQENQPQVAWHHTDIAQLNNSPFSTALPEGDWTAAATSCTGHLGQRQCDAYKHDAFKLYPRFFLMPDSQRIFFTRDGDYNSLRSDTGEYMRKTKFSYMMTVSGTPANPIISFERGPDLLNFANNSGTVIRDPNDPGTLLHTGGFPNYGGNLGPSLLDASDPRSQIKSDKWDISLANHYLGSRATFLGLNSYKMPESKTGKGSWSESYPNFLGPTDKSGRTMHYMVILPNRQLFLVGGGNFDFAQGVRYPILYTPKRDNTGKILPGQYSKREVAEINKERLYHSTAILLADGRVWMAGSNANRASINESEPIGVENKNKNGQKTFNPKYVDRDIYFFGSSNNMAKGIKPAPAEEWTSEIYSPPYLFIDPGRRTVIKSLKTLSFISNDFQFFSVYNNKIYYLFHSNMEVLMKLQQLPKGCSTEKGSLILLKLGAPTHGWDSGQRLYEIAFTSKKSDIWFVTPDSKEEQIVPGFYHLFYVDCHGKPTVAQPVRFDDNVSKINGRASRPL